MTYIGCASVTQLGFQVQKGVDQSKFLSSGDLLFFPDSAKQKIADEKAVKRAQQEMEKIEEQMEVYACASLCSNLGCSFC